MTCTASAPVGLVDEHGTRRADPMPVQENHGLADRVPWSCCRSPVLGMDSVCLMFQPSVSPPLGLTPPQHRSPCRAVRERGTWPLPLPTPPAPPTSFRPFSIQ